MDRGYKIFRRSKAFRDNWDRIFKKDKKKEEGNGKEENSNSNPGRKIV